LTGAGVGVVRFIGGSVADGLVGDGDVGLLLPMHIGSLGISAQFADAGCANHRPNANATSKPASGSRVTRPYPPIRAMSPPLRQR
jgi:hypothetical protein